MKPEQGQGLAPMWQGWSTPKPGVGPGTRGTGSPRPLFLHCRSKSRGELAVGVCAEWRGENRRCRRQQAPDGSKARPRNVPTSRPLINQGGEGEGSFPASVFTEHLSCAAPEREGFAELVKEGSCARQRGGRTIWRGKKEKGTLKMENYANREERGSGERGEGGREAEGDGRPGREP